MTGLKREDELKLKELNELCQQVGRRNLPEDDQLYMLYLEDCYDSFLEEGLRKLRGEYEKDSLKGIKRLFRCRSKSETSECKPQRKICTLSSSNNNNSSSADTVTTTEEYEEEKEKEEKEKEEKEGLCHERNKESSSTSISPLLDNPSSAGVFVSSQRSGNKLWSWITHDIIVGGVPHASSHRSTGHLRELWRQCVARGGSALTVISCLETEETIPVGFATINDWRRFTGIMEFYTVPFIPSEKQENPPEVSREMIEELLTLCSAINSGSHLNNMGGEDCVDGDVYRSIPCGKTGLCWKFHFGKGKGKGKVVSSNNNKTTKTTTNTTHRMIIYIMCKTGQTRSWVFAMIYLMLQYSMEYHEANQRLCEKREFHPSPAQMRLALNVSNYMRLPRSVEKSTEECVYLQVLTQVLSLSPLYQERLLRDLERLT